VFPSFKLAAGAGFGLLLHLHLHLHLHTVCEFPWEVGLIDGGEGRIQMNLHNRGGLFFPGLCRADFGIPFVLVTTSDFTNLPHFVPTLQNCTF